MSLTAGIVGLPNVGKSTLFNAITQSQVEAANYPFATIQPNVGVVEVRMSASTTSRRCSTRRKLSARLSNLRTLPVWSRARPKAKVWATRFLSHIRQVDAVCHVVRCFDNPDITHVEGSVDPIRDIEIINLELALADLQTVENRITKVERKAQAKDKEAAAEYAVLSKLVEALREGKAARSVELGKEEALIAKSYQLLTAKPMIYVANMSEDDIADPENNAYYKLVKAYAEAENNDVIAICAQIEEELSSIGKRREAGISGRAGNS